jgi:hypothetical protein
MAAIYFQLSHRNDVIVSHMLCERGRKFLGVNQNLYGGREMDLLVNSRESSMVVAAMNLEISHVNRLLLGGVSVFFCLYMCSVTFRLLFKNEFGTTRRSVIDRPPMPANDCYWRSVAIISDDLSTNGSKGVNPQLVQLLAFRLAFPFSDPSVTKTASIIIIIIMRLTCNGQATSLNQRHA